MCTLTNGDLIQLTAKLIHEHLVLKPENIKSAFRKTGIFPLSLEELRKQLPSERRKDRAKKAASAPPSARATLQQPATVPAPTGNVTQEIVWRPVLRTRNADGTTKDEVIATCPHPSLDLELFNAALRAVPPRPGESIRGHYAQGVGAAFMTTYIGPRNAILKEHLQQKAEKKAEVNTRLDGGTYYTTDEYRDDMHAKQLAQKAKEWQGIAKKAGKHPAASRPGPAAAVTAMPNQQHAVSAPVPQRGRRATRENAPKRSHGSRVSRHSAQHYDVNDLRPAYKRNRR